MGVAIPPFQVFLQEHRDHVYRFLVASAGPQDADDCFQETMLSALRAYPRLRANSNLRAWVLTIAQRKAIDAGRSNSRRPLPVADPPERGEAAREAEDDAELWAAVRKLPPKQRTAVALRFINDLEHREIGKVIGCSEQAARRNLHEGLERLREVWKR
jgi:RNA polymerase sigma factor (sigma-70 family)